MYSIDFGLFPFAGLLMGGMLFAVYWWVLRLRCQPRLAQAFIVVAMLLAEAVMFVIPVHTVEVDTHLPAVPQSRVSTTEEGGTTVIASNKQQMNENVTLAFNTVVPSEEKTGHLLSFPMPNVIRLLVWVYITGVMAMLFWLGVQLTSLRQLHRKYQWTDRVEGDICAYNLCDGGLPFSFGNSIFLPAKLQEPEHSYVLLHELFHVRHNHFAKLLLLNLLLAFGWFNPFLWLFIREMRMQQELEVDGDVLSEGVSRKDYQLSLVKLASRPVSWIQLRSSFMGHPLRQRLLFMNTTVNTRRAALRLIVAFSALFAIAVLLITASCRIHLYVERHPLQGCWQLTSYPEQYKFYGGYGELVYGISSGTFTNTSHFYMNGMEQHRRGDSLYDRYGQTLKYEMQDSNHVWHWLHFNKDYTACTEMAELWRPVQPNTQLTAMLHAMSRLDAVWQLDSVATDYHGRHYIKDKKQLNPCYLLISDSLYMRMEMNGEGMNRFLEFHVDGDCGPLRLQDDGHVLLRDIVCEILGQLKDNRLSLRIDESQNPHSGAMGLVTYYYSRIPMPSFIPSIFTPAL